MKKTFIKYLLLIVLLNGMVFIILILTAWDDGSPEVSPINKGMSFILKYILGAPVGFFFRGDFDMRLLLLIPINSALQFFGYRYFLAKMKK